MSCGPDTNLNERIFCCTGRTTAVVLSCLFLLTGIGLGGAIIYQYHNLKDASIDHNVDFIDKYLEQLAVPASFLVSFIGLCLLIPCHQNNCVLACMIWPIAVVILPGYFIHSAYDNHKKLKKLWDAGKSDRVIFLLPFCSAIGIILSVYCLMMLCCLTICAGRRGGGKEDIFGLEAERKSEKSKETDFEVEVSK